MAKQYISLLERLTDVELIKKYKSGNELAFECLLARYEKLIKHISNRYFGVGCDWEDFYQLASMAFLRAVNNYRTDLNASFYTYALSCIRHRLISKCRQLNKQNEYVMEDAKLLAIMDTKEMYSLEESMFQSSSFEIKLKTFEFKLNYLITNNQLSNLEKACLLEYIEGRSYADAAKRLGVTEKQVSQALFRCRRKAKDMNDNLGLSDKL